jgi:hypothetical protein
MPKKSKKQKKLFKISLGNKKVIVTKSRLEWAILIILIVSVTAAQVSGLYPYIYNYARCDGAPLEVRGSYYRIPYDDIYGIHIGSDYGRCFDGLPTDLQRDPSTKAERAKEKKQADEANRLKRLAAEYKIYVPNGYAISSINTSEQGDGLQTMFSIIVDGDRRFSVREMKKDSDFSYTNLCSKPAEENWSGTIIGKDDKGREICRTNISKYIKEYIVGINIGETAIMLQAANNTAEESESLNAEAIAIFSTMTSYSN